eukprot:2933237-Rhodomonas_salina.2
MRWERASTALRSRGPASRRSRGSCRATRSSAAGRPATCTPETSPAAGPEPSVSCRSPMGGCRVGGRARRELDGRGKWWCVLCWLEDGCGCVEG